VSLNVKEAEERAQERLKQRTPSMLPHVASDLAFVALADLARRLLEEHEYTHDTDGINFGYSHAQHCSRCKALTEARKAELLKKEGS